MSTKKMLLTSTQMTDHMARDRCNDDTLRIAYSQLGAKQGSWFSRLWGK